MSDDRTNSELFTALGELAAANETFPALTGAEVRGRAVRRGRRRMAGTLGAVTAALALVAFALTVDLTDSADSANPAGPGGSHRIPAATPTVPSASPSVSTPSPVASSAVPPTPVTAGLDLRKRVLIVGKRAMPLTDSSLNTPKVVGPLTVYDKQPDVKILTVVDSTAGARYNAEISYAVELRDADNEPVYVGAALGYDKENIGKYETSGGWIDLDASDAKWFYASVKTGTAIEVTGTTS
ncbi:hypothetical protein [Streptomyces sp. NPDC051572]|uniref:hypothetical protein n=1 Tax=unclassified Streptomyces TaxID=2593676 RepID=UPI00344C62FC